MSKASTLNQDFHRIICENPELLSWLTNEMNLGYYYSNLTKSKEFLVAQSIWTQLDYNEPASEDLADLWWQCVGNEGRHKIENFSNLIITGKKLPEEKCLSALLTRDGELLNCEVKHFIHKDAMGNSHLILKFVGKKESQISNTEFSRKIKRLRKFNEIYEETNELATVGGWDVDLVKNTITWTKVTKEIHGLTEEYEPNLETAINFFKEGWSRDLIIKLFTECTENGTPYDAELIIVLNDGREKWVRSMGKAEMWEGKCIRVYGAFQDINDRKIQELEKHEAELRFKNVFENSSLGIVLVNGKSQLEMVNPVARKIFGLEHLSDNDILQYTFKDVIKPDFLDLAVQHRKNLLSGEVDKYNIEVECYHFKGHSIWCNLNCSLVKNGSDNLIITQVEDITHKKRLERKSLENATRFKRVFEFSPNGMALVDLRGRWRNVNNNLAAMLGYTKEEIVNYRIEEITHPDDRDNDIHEFSKIIKHQIDSYQIKKRYIHKNGHIVHCYLTVSGLKNEHGEVSSLIGHVVDMTDEINAKTALEKSLLDLRALLDSTTQVIIIETDLNHVIRKFNKGAENLLGYKAEDVVDKMTPSVFHLKEEMLDYAIQLEELYGEPVATHKVFTHKLGKNDLEASDWTYVRKDGSELQVHLVVTAIKNEQGEIKGYLGVASDISDLKAMEASLLKAKTRAENANRSKSEFLANMSHEIRTPLNGVIGFTDILMQTDLNENQRKYMETVYTSAVSLLDLINDILDFSKIEAGKLEINEEHVNLSDLCGRSVEMIKQLAHEKNIEILLNIPGNLNHYVMADGLRLRQVLINLLSNSVKFTHKGEIELKIEQQGIDEESQKRNYKFSIRDTGIGIAPQNLQKIFRAFDQEDASTTRKYGGTGLGLTISNRLLELMGSKLEVTSELGFGTTFSFTVNFANEPYLTNDTPNDISLKRVLIIDDNQNNRVILKEMLSSRNIETTLVENGIDALEILEGDIDYDLAIIDYHMPYINGIDLVCHMRNELKIPKEKLPVLLLHSSGEDQQINSRSEELGIINKMVKPVQRHQLFEFIDDFENPVALIPTTFETVEPIDLTTLTPTILIAEDNPVNKFLTRTIIRKLLPLAKLIEVDDGFQAVEAFKNSTPIDFILMDIQMPIMSGFEATEEIRLLENEERRIPIIALTARAIKGERERCLQNGMDDYVSKPVVLDDLKKCVEQFLVEKDKSGDCKSIA
ncbi:PAS domain-containing hybrid sensor histidine kinase/response regulator [Leeuwenhoekiella sp. MAR_2009_132]|uniref:PAS domain-containing hybrid sensor histidine kinase/response regulator n=1 Tax=Leeuwenhoekiella sp. MAR_2009_132 TaxID=1392489 RepID=UPI000690B7A5|nr:PAS domain-containing hybrid sensor histidine kinase/response regulator [Leeuwenhoekiella sp. MAR_2009_132]